MLLKAMKLFDRMVPKSAGPWVKEFYYAAEYYRRNPPLVYDGRESFSHVLAETNTDCNQACSICPRSVRPRKGGLMDLGLYEELLDQLAFIDFDGEFSPVFYNEPLLDARLPALMRKARGRLPKAKLIIYTNGSLMTKDNATELVDAGVDLFVVTQYAGNQPAGDVSGVIAALPKRTGERVRYRVLTDDMPLSTRGGMVAVKKPIEKNRCYQASTQSVVTNEGDIALCCNDYDAANIFGNIGQKPIFEIWNDAEFKAERQRLRKGKFTREICQKCAGCSHKPI